MNRPKVTFSLWTLVALVVGNAVGAGIYTTSGFALADLGSREWVLLAWLVAGFIALAGAISYGMLVRGLTESGGEYLFLSRSIHPLAGFIAGWVSLLAGFPGAIAFSALAFDAYMRSAVPSLQALPLNALALIITLAAGLLHGVRVKAGNRGHEGFVSLMLGALCVVIVWSAIRFFTSATLPVTTELSSGPFNVFVFANTLVWVSLSYSGFNAAAYVAGEVEDARHIVPKGMILGTLLTMLLCVLINAIMIYGVEANAIRGRPDIATQAALALGGEPARRIVELMIAVSLLTSITAMTLAGPRVYAKMADDGALPALFKQYAGLPPRAAIGLQVAIALTLIMLSDLRGLMSYLGFTLSLCLAMAVSSLFVRHYRFGERPASMWYPVAPIVFVGCTLLFACLSAINDSRQFIAAIPTVVIGVLAYFVSVKSRRMK
ncbi:APC family permease [Arenicella xantha]|uniref:APC family permease n=1 Tax=Arenicella xantha TaxID=644221 RepID=UPI001474C73C|nr:amino acid permease [Arenicella xantha]